MSSINECVHNNAKAMTAAGFLMRDAWNLIRVEFSEEGLVDTLQCRFCLCLKREVRIKPIKEPKRNVKRIPSYWDRVKK